MEFQLGMREPYELLWKFTSQGKPRCGEKLGRGGNFIDVTSPQ